MLVTKIDRDMSWWRWVRVASEDGFEKETLQVCCAIPYRLLAEATIAVRLLAVAAGDGKLLVVAAQHAHQIRTAE